jgi:putative mRNA 3-end processing factor
LLEARDFSVCTVPQVFLYRSPGGSGAVITHAHSDHASPGSKQYLTSRRREALLRARVGPECDIQSLTFEEPLKIGDISLSFHPAGHILGSAQVRLEHAGEVWVMSGDYKLAADPTCPPFEPVRCHTFVTESTLTLPIFCSPNRTASPPAGTVRKRYAVYRD